MRDCASRANCRGLLGSIGMMTVAMTVTLSRSAAAGDLPAATMLFNEARRLVATGRYGEACPKFEESQRLDPGIGTQFNLADCFEHTGRTATAWALFLDVASAAGGSGQGARESVARKRAAALEPKLSKLTIKPPKDVDGLEVRRNGEAVSAVLWNSPVPVDPGGYAIAAMAPGRKSWSTLTTVEPDASAVTVVIPTLEVEPVASPPEPLEASAAAAPPPTNGDSFVPAAPMGGLGATDDGRDPPYKFIALALGGSAVVGVGIGTFFGLRSIAKHADYERFCVGSVCSQAAASLHSDAVTAGNISTVSFLVGGALAAGGAALWLYAPKPAAHAGVRLAPTLGASIAGAIVAGDW